MFKIKDGYKLDLQTTETMRLFRNSRKKLIDKTKNGKSVLGFEVVEVVLVQCNVADDQYKQKSEVLLLLHLINLCLSLYVEPSNLVCLQTKNTEFYDIITFTDQNCRPLEIEDKVNLTLLINK